MEALAAEGTQENVKYQCMLKNNVKILTSTELFPIIDELDKKYGEKFIEKYLVK